MGSDDRNEGSGPGECVEHRFKLVGASVGLDGAFEEYECLRCGAEAMNRAGDIDFRPSGVPEPSIDDALGD